MMPDALYIVRRVTPILTPALLLGALNVGCNGNGGITPAPPHDAREALQRINDNLGRIDGALFCKARTSFRFRDANGADRRFLFHPATVIFEAPRCLYFDIKHSLGGSVARIGSNDEHYWLWIDTPEARKLWHGTWQSLELGRARRMAVPPNQLLDALMLRPLPEWLPGGLRPLLVVDGKDRRLIFLELDEAGWPHATRELVLDRRPPYMPVEIVDRLPDGRVVMHAYLKRYGPVKSSGPEGPYTAHRYAIYWPLDQAEMRLDLSEVRYRSSDVPFCEFPGDWQGEVETLDESPAFHATESTPESIGQP